MPNEVAIIQPGAMNEIERMATAIANSRLFGVQNKDQAVALLLISSAEGRHPALAAMDYDIIQNKPAKKSAAMLRDFLTAGGTVKWHKLDDTIADATFSHPSGGEVRISWDMNRVKQAKIANPNYDKYPRQMLRARCVSEGVRTVFPAATSGLYEPGEVAEFGNVKDAEYKEVMVETPSDQDKAKELAANLKKAETLKRLVDLQNEHMEFIAMLSEGDAKQKKLYDRLSEIITEKTIKLKPEPSKLSEDFIPEFSSQQARS